MVRLRYQNRQLVTQICTTQSQVQESRDEVSTLQQEVVHLTCLVDQFRSTCESKSIIPTVTNVEIRGRSNTQGELSHL